MRCRNDHALSFECRESLAQRAAANAELPDDILLAQRLARPKHAPQYRSLQLLIDRLRHQCGLGYLLEIHGRYRPRSSQSAAWESARQRPLRGSESIVLRQKASFSAPIYGMGQSP